MDHQVISTSPYSKPSHQSDEEKRDLVQELSYIDANASDSSLDARETPMDTYHG